MISKFIPNFPNYCIMLERIVKNIKLNRILKQSSNQLKLNNEKLQQRFRVNNLMYVMVIQNGIKLLLGEIVKHMDGNTDNFGLTNLVKTTRAGLKRTMRAGLKRTIGEPVLDRSKKWITVKDFPDYFVSDCGDIFSIKTNKLMSQHLGDSNYYKVVVYNSKKYNKLVHNLVYYSFNPKVIRTKEYQIDHIDRNSKNNKLNNLRLVTRSENGKNRNFKPKIVPVTQYYKTGDVIKVWNNITDIESQLGYSRSNIYLCCNGKIKTAYGFIWKKNLKQKVIDISGYKSIIAYNSNKYNNYLINECGDILNITTKYKLKPILYNGYMHVHLVTYNGKKNGCRIHKLVALVFLENKNNYTVVNHKDRNKLNNHVSNLEWCTPKQNTTHAIGKKVVQIDPVTNKIIQRFDSIAEASRHVTGKKSNLPIANACNNDSKLSYGYKWRWIEIV